MIYYHDENLLIRDMVEADILTSTEAELAQGWQVESAKQDMRYRHQQEGRSFTLVAEYKGEIAGYINLYRKVIDGPSIFRTSLKSSTLAC